MPADVRININYLIIYGGLPEKKLKTIYEEFIKGIPWKKFYELYSYVTSVPYTFLYINRSDKNDIRINFDNRIKM